MWRKVAIFGYTLHVKKKVWFVTVLICFIGKSYRIHVLVTDIYTVYIYTVYFQLS